MQWKNQLQFLLCKGVGLLNSWPQANYFFVHIEQVVSLKDSELPQLMVIEQEKVKAKKEGKLADRRVDIRKTAPNVADKICFY